jgi:hypothetical protein
MLMRAHQLLVLLPKAICLTVFDRHNRAALEQQQAWLPLVRAVELSKPSFGFPSDLT